MRGGRGAFVIVAVVLVAIVAIALAGAARPRERTTTPLDPASTEADGTRALVLLYESFGLDVRVTDEVPTAETRATVVVLRDELSTPQRRALLAWVDGGGSLVVTDPDSALHPGGGRDGGGGPAFGAWPRATCTIEALAAIDGLDRLALDDEVAYPLGPEDRGCFGSERRAFVLERTQDAGRVTALGGPSPFLNGRLDEEGNAALALALAGRDGRTDVVLLQPEILAGDKTLAQLVPRHVWMALAQLGAAALALAWWRSRRLGRPVVEPDPVAVPGSELVVAVGALSARSRHVARTADALRTQARRDLASRLGVDATTSTAVLDRLVSARAGVPAGSVVALLDGPAPRDDAVLVELATDLDRLRQEVP